MAASCASYTQENREVRQLYTADRYREALEKLEESSIKDEGKNRLLYRMEKASLLDRMGERAKARKLLIEADKIADELFTVSVSKTVTSFLVNDASTDYDGEDYERVFIHTMLALGFLQDNDINGARIEARKINNKLYEINQKYDDNKNRYAEDALARLLSGMIFEASGDLDSAIVDYKSSLKLYEGTFQDFNDSKIPTALIQSLYRTLQRRNRGTDATAIAKAYPKVTQEVDAFDSSHKEAGEVVVIHEVGAIAIKENTEIILPIGGQVIRASFPVIKKRGFVTTGGAGVEIEGPGTFYPAAQAVSLTEIASATLDDKRSRLIAKEGGRLVAKAALTEQAYKNFGPIGGIAANIYSAVSNTGDTRGWTLLPHAILITKVRLKPGSYSLRLKGPYKIDSVQKVQIVAGKTLFFRTFE